MTDEEREMAEPTSGTETPETPDVSASESGAPTATTNTNDAQARIAELERLLASERDAATDYMQRWQRAVADFTNFKRRAQQEQEQHERLFAAQALAPVLNALDSFERAFTSLPDSLRGYTWIEGVALVEYQLRRALEAQEIREVAAEPGQAFDPAQHQAVGEVETDQHPAGHIAVLLQRGYATAGMLIRPALVQVARAPVATPQAEGEPAADDAAPEETQPSGPAP
jgi:molecular chaperone GrpE